MLPLGATFQGLLIPQTRQWSNCGATRRLPAAGFIKRHTPPQSEGRVVGAAGRVGWLGVRHRDGVVKGGWVSVGPCGVPKVGVCTARDTTTCSDDRLGIMLVLASQTNSLKG